MFFIEKQSLFDTDNNHSSFLFVCSPRKAISLIWISKKTKFGPRHQSHLEDKVRGKEEEENKKILEV